jgi:hypothetical protein
MMSSLSQSCGCIHSVERYLAEVKFLEYVVEMHRRAPELRLARMAESEYRESSKIDESLNMARGRYEITDCAMDGVRQGHDVTVDSRVPVRKL